MLDYPAKLTALEALRTVPVLCSQWPDTHTAATLEEALRAAGDAALADDFRSALHAARASFDMLSRPIIAVLGELKAGKSSVVASFLSPAGRVRVPRGEDAEQGTHRFVYWVPARWLDDEAIQRAFFELLAAVHGQQREYLSPDPAEAAAQYRSGRDHLDRLRVPLIAADPELDRLGAALLDCPDVQTKDESPGGPPADANPRLDFVRQAARICSAFLLLWERSKIRDGLLATFLAGLRHQMPTVPVYLLINKIRPEKGQPTRTRNDADLAQLLDRFQLDPQGCYGAFDFDIFARGDLPGWQELTPPALVARHQGERERFPQFFALAPEAAANEPGVVAETRFLACLPEQLDKAALQQQKLADHWHGLATLVDTSLVRVQAWAASCAGRVRQLHAGLLGYCVTKFTDPKSGEPLQIPTSDFTAALKDSFVRTAPRWVSWSMRMSNVFERAVKDTKKSLRKLLPFGRALDSAQQLSVKLTEQLQELGIFGAGLSSELALARDLQNQRWVPATLGEEPLAAAWSEVLRNFYRFPLEHDPAKLDAMTRDVWTNLSFWQKARVAARGILLSLGTVAALGGVVTAAVDGGITLLATHSLATTLAGAIPGLTALGVAALGGGAAFAGFLLGTLQLNTLPYLARFFALACDAFGIPRSLDDGPIQVPFGKGQQRRQFALPPAGIPAQPVICPLEEIRLWRDGPALERFQEVLRHD